MSPGLENIILPPPWRMETTNPLQNMTTPPPRKPWNTHTLAFLHCCVKPLKCDSLTRHRTMNPLNFFPASYRVALVVLETRICSQLYQSLCQRGASLSSCVDKRCRVEPIDKQMRLSASRLQGQQHRMIGINQRCRVEPTQSRTPCTYATDLHNVPVTVNCELSCLHNQHNTHTGTVS